MAAHQPLDGGRHPLKVIPKQERAWRKQTRCAVTQFVIEMGQQSCIHMNFKGTTISVTQLLLFEGRAVVVVVFPAVKNIK